MNDEEEVPIYVLPQHAVCAVVFVYDEHRNILTHFKDFDPSGLEVITRAELDERMKKRATEIQNTKGPQYLSPAQKKRALKNGRWR